MHMRRLNINACVYAYTHIHTGVWGAVNVNSCESQNYESFSENSFTFVLNHFFVPGMQDNYIMTHIPMEIASFSRMVCHIQLQAGTIKEKIVRRQAFASPKCLCCCYGYGCCKFKTVHCPLMPVCTVCSQNTDITIQIIHIDHGHLKMLELPYNSDYNWDTLDKLLLYLFILY